MNAVERVNQIINLKTASITAPLVENHELITAVQTWFLDAQSRSAYEQELSFKCLQALLPMEQAIHYSSGVKTPVFAQTLAVAKNLHLEGKLPSLEFGNLDEFLFYYPYATTFLLEQYKYAPQLMVQSAEQKKAAAEAHKAAFEKSGGNPKELNLPTEFSGDIFLDCGGFAAETSIWAIMQGASKSYSFEASPRNQALMQKNIATNGMSDSISVVPVALGKEVDTGIFAENHSNPAISRLVKATETAPENSVNVKITTLDIWCASNNVKPDFIKLNLNGSEMATILGAETIIKTCKPRLAIALQYNISDMWAIPYTLKQLCPDYKLWCRKNTDMSEFILYASV